MANDCNASWSTYPQVIPAFSNKGRGLYLGNAVLVSVKLILQSFFLHTNEPTKSSVRLV